MKAVNDIIPPTPAKFESFIQEVGGTRKSNYSIAGRNHCDRFNGKMREIKERDPLQAY